MTVKTTILRGANKCINKEAVAAAGITPGHLIERVAAGTVQVHSTAVGNALPAFARENEVVGKDIDTAYVATEQVLFSVCPPGTEIFAWIATGVTVVIGTPLVSNGDGTLKLAVAATTDHIVGYSLSALTASGAERCKIEVA